MSLATIQAELWASKISTQVNFPNETTTVTRANDLDVIGVIHWNSVGMNTVTMDGVTRDLNDVFPRSGRMSMRVNPVFGLVHVFILNA